MKVYQILLDGPLEHSPSRRAALDSRCTPHECLRLSRGEYVVIQLVNLSLMAETLFFAAICSILNPKMVNPKP